MCVECRWRWTVSITGKIYVQSIWTQSSTRAKRAAIVRRLLESIDGLADKLDRPWPMPNASDEAQLEQAGFSEREVARLRRVRDATAAAYFNEGIPLATLRDEGILLPPLDQEA